MAYFSPLGGSGGLMDDIGSYIKNQMKVPILGLYNVCNQNTCNSVIETYNFTLLMNTFIEYLDLNVWFTNENIERIL
jgi:hypothetical protein